MIILGVRFPFWERGWWRDEQLRNSSDHSNACAKHLHVEWTISYRSLRYIYSIRKQCMVNKRFPKKHLRSRACEARSNSGIRKWISYFGADDVPLTCCLLKHTAKFDLLIFSFHNYFVSNVSSRWKRHNFEITICPIAIHILKLVESLCTT